MRATLWGLLVLGACGYGGGDSFNPGLGGASAGDAGTAGCLPSNECPTGYTCSDFGVCEPPAPMSDGGVPPAPGAEKAVILTVGFRPRAVQFVAPGDRAYVITQDGVSVIDLGFATAHGATIVPPIPVADPAVSPDDLEVNIVSPGE